jgi:hypothetical protein
MHQQDPPTTVGSFGHVLKVAKRIAYLAKIYDCVDILRPRLAATLHQHQQKLFLAIKDDRPRFAILACLLEDSSI